MTYAAQRYGVEQDKVADILKDTSDKVGDFLQNGGGPLKDFFDNIAPQVGGNGGGVSPPLWPRCAGALCKELGKGQSQPE
ncbi:hypothetical protein ACJJID_01415 [Microbulbifer sp. CnH-101-G]|uniref:hypothetical protein n=1 Tax=Microbulbifer sp. CnH-101-G TaxID=3243393 RepID=UPI0040392F7E